MAAEVHEKWGFGMAPAKLKTMADRRMAVQQILQILDARSLPISSPSTLAALSTVKGMFTRIFREDQWDWFSVMGQLGYPSRELARAISTEISYLRSSISSADESSFWTVQINLHRLPIRKCLRAFLGELVLRDEADVGWLYILSTREIRDLLKVGMTTRTVEERASEINRATGVAIPFGVRRCWRVRNPLEVERQAHACLSDVRIRGDREFFRIDFHEAARRIGTIMQTEGYEVRTLGNLTHLALDG